MQNECTVCAQVVPNKSTAKTGCDKIPEACLVSVGDCAVRPLTKKSGRCALGCVVCLFLFICYWPRGELKRTTTALQRMLPFTSMFNKSRKSKLMASAVFDAAEKKSGGGQLFFILFYIFPPPCATSARDVRRLRHTKPRTEKVGMGAVLRYLRPGTVALGAHCKKKQGWVGPGFLFVSYFFFFVWFIFYGGKKNPP